ncbi:hypothetical protein [Corynebacterium nuruki]|jgi:hypothetical protein|uniref:hypothetical protein n=1 Tax=Corynebacterium nuruki TaxID=1032851 RepID=UPI0002485C45|nr:hypothetical protein [Corynebacterium nuruki]
MSIKKKPAAWQVRKIAYGLAAVVIGVLGWVGVLSDIQADQVADKVDQWLPILLGVIAPALAATKTNPGSDSTATDEDLAVGARGALHEQVGRVGTAILGQLDNLPSAVLAAIRAEEKGEHDTTASAAATAEASTDYVYGR